MGRYETPSEWTKVKDELPNDGEKVLIAILSRYKNAPWRYAGEEAVYKNKEWCGEKGYPYVTPEYWMLWPTLPFVEDFGGIENE